MNVVIITMSVALLLALSGCDKPVATTELIRPVLTVKVSANPRASLSTYSGEVRARYENDVAFRVAGKITARLVEVGQSVARGQVLARLDPQDLQLQVDANTAQLASVEADLALARAELERNKTLRTQNFISQAVVDQKQQLFDAATARIQQVRSQLEVARNSATYTTLAAERDGVVITATAEPGQVVTAGQTIFRIARLDTREVLINVPENRIEDLRATKALSVQLWTHPDKNFVGRVREIAPTADPATRTFNVRVALPDADESVRLGMTANVAILGNGVVPAAIEIPPGALGDRDGSPVVWIADPITSTVQPKPVQVAQYRENAVVLKGGLSGGETIVIAGLHKLFGGQKVRIADARGNAVAQSAR